MSEACEGELHFDFTHAIRHVKLDAPGSTFPKHWKIADFVIEEEDRILLVEIKDPSHSMPGITSEYRKDLQRRLFTDKLKTKDFVSEEIAPTARDSYFFLHLMEEDSKPIFFVLLIGLERLPATARELLLPLAERIRGRLRQEMEQPWRRRYVQACLVLDEQDWRLHFPQFPLRRQPPTENK